MPSVEPSPDLSRGWRLIKTKNFGLLWWGQTTSQIGEGLNKVALLWFVYELTGSAMKMTMVGALADHSSSLVRSAGRCVFGSLAQKGGHDLGGCPSGSPDISHSRAVRC